jgi:Carboxypeptidase regulatory-like domain
MKVRSLPIVVTAAFALFDAGHEFSHGGPPVRDGAVSGSVVVTGTVKFDGVAPRPTRVSMSADPDCAKLHPAGVSSEDFLTGANGSLQNVVVFVSDGLGERFFDPPKQPEVFEQKGCMYRPHLVAMRTNQELDVINNDNITHNLHPVPRNNREWNKSQLPGTHIEVTFAREEIAIPVKCNVHPWMKSYISVFRHPYFAVTGKSGRFELSNLPPGTYTIQAWHEKLGTATQKITVGPDATKEMEFVFKAQSGH